MAEFIGSISKGELMKRTDWKYLVDTLLFLCIVGIAMIGLLLGLFIPKGPKAAESAKYFLELHRHQWGNIHFYLSIAFIILVIIHIVLSWSWIKGKARQAFKKGWKVVLTMTAVSSILVVFLFWIFYPKVPGAYEDHGVRAGKRPKENVFEETYLKEESVKPKKESQIKEEIQQVKLPSEEQEENFARGHMAEDASGILITGQMTLDDIERETSIPARKIAEKLGLPQDVSLQEKLGHLRKRYAFTMQEVRDVVSSLLK